MGEVGQDAHVVRVHVVRCSNTSARLPAAAVTECEVALGRVVLLAQGEVVRLPRVHHRVHRTAVQLVKTYIRLISYQHLFCLLELPLEMFQRLAKLLAVQRHGNLPAGVHILHLQCSALRQSLLLPAPGPRLGAVAAAAAPSAGPARSPGRSSVPSYRTSSGGPDNQINSQMSLE